MSVLGRIRRLKPTSLASARDRLRRSFRMRNRPSMRGGPSFVISGLGVVLAGLSLWYLIVFKALALPTGEMSAARLILSGLEVVLLGGFSIVLVYAGYWLATSQFDNQKIWWAGMWTVVGLAGIVAIVALVQSVQFTAGTLDKPSLIQELLLAAGGGGIAGLLIGISTVQAMWNEEQVAQQRDSMSFINELLRHNVLNGMQVVLGYTELLRGEVDSPEANDHIDAIHDRGTDIVDLVQNVRVLGQAVSGEIQFSEVRLSELLRSEVESARAAYPETTFETDIEAGLLVAGDDLLSAAFENVIANAVDHNDSAEPHVTVSAERDGATVRVRVTDNGPGIPDEFKESYFHAGAQHAGSVGQGLGLYLAQTLVTRCDGDIRVEDNESRGAVLVVDLPVAQ